MRYLIFFVGALCIPVFAFAAAPGDIVISEIMYDLKDVADADHEWVEVFNTTGAAVDLTDWKFNDGSNHLLNAPPKNGGQGSLTIPASGYAVLSGDAAVFLSDHPGFSGIVIDTVMSLNNTGATLSLIDQNSATIDSVAYQKEQGANGNGKTLEKVNASWQESAADGGTPGAQNSGSAGLTTSGGTSSSAASAPPAPAFVVDAGADVAARAGEDITFSASVNYNGLLTYTWNLGDGTLKEGKQVTHRYLFPGVYQVTVTASDEHNQSQDQLQARVYPTGVFVSEIFKDWIELVNESSWTADVSGWEITSGGKSFRIPNGTFVQSGAFLVLSSAATGFSFNGIEGTVLLKYPDGAVAHEVRYKGGKESYSVARRSGSEFAWTAHPTPGAQNMFGIASASEGASVSGVLATVPEISDGSANTVLPVVQSHVAGVADPANQIEPVISAAPDGAKQKEVSEQTAAAGGAFPWNVYLLILGVVAALCGGFIVIKARVKNE